jgi:hypothetical protein
MRSMKKVQRQEFLQQKQVVHQRDLETLWDPNNRGSHAAVISGLLGNHVIIIDTHCCSTVTVESIETLVYDEHKVPNAPSPRRLFHLRRVACVSLRWPVAHCVHLQEKTAVIWLHST